MKLKSLKTLHRDQQEIVLVNQSNKLFSVRNRIQIKIYQHIKLYNIVTNVFKENIL